MVQASFVSARASAPSLPLLLRGQSSEAPSHSVLSPFMTSPVLLVQSASILPRVASASLPLTPVCLYMGCPAHAYTVSQAELPLPAWPYTSDPVPSLFLFETDQWLSKSKQLARVPSLFTGFCGAPRQTQRPLVYQLLGEPYKAIQDWTPASSPSVHDVPVPAYTILAELTTMQTLKSNLRFDASGPMHTLFPWSVMPTYLPRSATHLLCKFLLFFQTVAQTSTEGSLS